MWLSVSLQAAGPSGMTVELAKAAAEAKRTGNTASRQYAGCHYFDAPPAIRTTSHWQAPLRAPAAAPDGPGLVAGGPSRCLAAALGARFNYAVVPAPPECRRRGSGGP